MISKICEGLFSFLRMWADATLLLLYALWILVSWPARFALSFRQKSLKDEVILVTGSAGGIGSEICLQLAQLEKSITLVCWDTSAAMNEALVRRLEKTGIHRAIGITVDIGDEADVKLAYKKVCSEVGPVTILVNNAGIAGDIMPLWDQRSASIEKVLRVNLLSHFWTLQACLPDMLNRGRGHIVTNCSILGHVWARNSATYTASKHGVYAYLKCLQEDIRSDSRGAKIHFTTAYPYFCRTNILSGMDIKPKYGGMLNPDEVAKAIILGMRRNQEHVFIPGLIKYAAISFALFPSSVVKMSLKIFDFTFRSVAMNNGAPLDKVVVAA